MSVYGILYFFYLCSYNQGNESIVNILLENDANVDTIDSEGRSALRAAVFSGHENVVKLLVKYGADGELYLEKLFRCIFASLFLNKVNKSDAEKRSILHVAIYMGHAALVNYLAANGACVKYRDMLGRGMLATSIFSRSPNPKHQIEIIKSLLKHGAPLDQVDNEGQTPLILATQLGHVHIVDLLIQSGADMDAIDHRFYTAIAYAVKNNSTALVDLLLRKNAATHILDAEGRSILSLAAAAGARDSLRLLMERGLDEMHRDNYGWTALHESSKAGHVFAAQMLLDYGSEVDARDNDGKTSLFYACQEGHLEIARLIVERGASLFIRSHQGDTSFRAACLLGKREICEFLLERGAEINYLDLDGRSTLYSLVCSNQNVIYFTIDFCFNAFLSKILTNFKDETIKFKYHF